MILEGIGATVTGDDTKNKTIITRDLNQSPSSVAKFDPHASSSSLLQNDMITDAMEFPCMEASRCFLTEKNNGLRLGIVANNRRRNRGDNEDSSQFELTLHKGRSKAEEWYVDLDTETLPSGGIVRKIQLRHVLTGQYLQANEDGRVATQSSKSDWTTWFMEPVDQVPDDGVQGPPSSQQYHLVPRASPPRKLHFSSANAFDTQLSGRNSQQGLQLNTSDLGEPAIWELEFSSGELCFVSNPVTHGKIRCNPLGQLSVSSKYSGWEVFRFIEVGNGQLAISSWTHSHKYLSSDPDGRVSTTENRLGEWEKWYLERAVGGVCIVSVANRGRYLSLGKENEEPFCTTTKPGDFAKWHFETAHSHIYHLTCPTVGMQVSGSRRGAFMSKNRRNWEEWRMERSDDGMITFFNPVHAKYLGCNAKGDVHTTSMKGDWSMWEMQESPHGGIFLRSKAHERQLACHNGKLVTTFDVFTSAETWRIEPRLPTALSGQKIAAFGVAGAFGLALTFAMPFAVLTAVEAAGMATTEIGLFFTAEAIAGFGGGALLSAGMMGSASSLLADMDGSQDLSPKAGEQDCIEQSLRPLSGWRNWI